MKYLFIFILLIITVCGYSEDYLSVRMPANVMSVMLKHTGYICSYNLINYNPNYVAWCLAKYRIIKNTKRTSYSFIPDNMLPNTEQVTSNEYTNSGYDRGHMCPAADNAYSAKLMKESFYMTNICPQHPDLNRIYWADLENKTRVWLKRTSALFIIAGPIYTDATPKTIGQYFMISLPNAFFKVILDLDNRQAVGFYYTNDQQYQSINNAIRSVDEIEKITGYDFFYELPDDIENKLEKNYSKSFWK